MKLRLLETLAFCLSLICAAPGARAESGRESHFRYDETIVSYRGASGIGVHPYGAENGVGVSLQVGVSFGPMFVWRIRRVHELSYLSFALELGYTYFLEELLDLDQLRSGHYFTLGAVTGLMFDTPITLQLLVTFLVGSNWDGTSLGVRSGVRVGLMAMLGLEVAHQWVSSEDPKGSHGIRMLVFLDVGLLLLSAFHPANYAG